MNDYVARLKDSVERLHGWASTHVATVPLTEQFEGKIRWQGEVEIFALHGHPEAGYCYAWSYLDDNQIEQHTAVLEIPPVDSPRNAVRAAIAAQGKARSNKGHEP